MNARVYASAIARLGESVTSEKAVAGLIKNLKDKGRLKLLPAILRELKRMDAGKLATTPLVEVSRESEMQSALSAAKSAGIDAKEAVVNASLLQGWRARGNGKLIDMSAKSNLLDLYRKITS